MHRALVGASEGTCEAEKRKNQELWQGRLVALQVDGGSVKRRGCPQINPVPLNRMLTDATGLFPNQGPKPLGSPAEPLNRR
jgi:hypothetical protein